MRVAILDPFAGISGDMLLGALLDVGVDREWLRGLPGRLGLGAVEVDITQVKRCSVSATKVDFRFAAEESQVNEHGRHIGELMDLIRRSPLSTSTKDRATEAFRLVGEAEGRVHGVAPEEVHLHEVGAVDAILDIVGGVEGFERRGVERVFHLPVAVGSGWVHAAHGELPVPAPATSYLLEGIELRDSGPVEGEATTPTGAALLRVLSEGPPLPRWRMVASGWGAGTRDPSAYPNVLRLMVAETVPEASVVEVITTDIDDLVPEYLEPLREALFSAGALDCSIWPTHGKKGRVGVRVEVLSAAGDADSVVSALFANSTTAGVRRWMATRSTLTRREHIVELEGGNRVRIKVWDGPNGPRLKPEYDDVVAAAAALGRPALEIAREAQRRAEAVLDREREART